MSRMPTVSHLNKLLLTKIVNEASLKLNWIKLKKKNKIKI